jgi:hypothetical protein
MRRARHPIRGRLRPVRRRPRPQALAEATVRPSATVDSDARQPAPRHPWTRRGAGPRLVVASDAYSSYAAAAAESQGCLSPRLHPMPASDEFLTVAEIAAELKMNQQSIRDWI